MNELNYQKMSIDALRFANKYIESPEAEAANENILLYALGEMEKNK
jgi:hypothetical protein